jgi:hypothetical protein
MMQQATGPKRSYTWKPYSNAIQQQSAHRLLDEWVAKANELGSISATGRALGSMNPFERGRQIAQQVRHGQPGQGALNALRWTGLGHLIPGAAPKNEGLLPEVSRATRSLFSPTLTPETIQKLNQLPEFKGKPSHLAPQLLNAYYHGTAAQERLLNDLSREGVFGTLEPSEQQQQMQAMTNAALKGVGFNPDSIFNWTPTGSSEIDAAMALGTVDVVGSNLARLNRRFSGMPDVGQLGKAVEASGASGKLGTLNDQARKYMLNVQQAHGDAGLKAVANALRTGSELPYLQEQGLLQTLGKTEAMALSDAAQLAAARSAPATQSIAALKKQLTAMKNSGGAVVGNLSMRQIDALLNQVTLLEGMTPSVRETTFRGMLDNGFTMPGGGKKKNLIPASEIKNLARGPTPGIIPPLDSAGKWQLSGAADAAWHADVRKMLADPAARIPGMSSEIKDLLAAHPRGAEIVKQVFTDPAFKARLATNIPVTLAELNSIAKAMPKERFLRRSFAGLRGIPRWAGYLLPLIALETAVYSGRPGSSSVSEEIDYDLSSPR